MNIVFIAALLLYTPSINGEESDGTNEYEYDCSRYLAPASIPGAGFGIFTTRDIKKNEPVLHFSDAPSVPIIDIAIHTENDDGDFWTHVDYNWGGSGLAEYEGHSVAENVFALGCLANFHTYLKNVKPVSQRYDDRLIDRFRDPGAGAFSYHSGHIFKASVDIKAGQELFGDYGEEWLDSREGTFADFVPRKDDFDSASNIWKKLEKKIAGNKLELNDAFLSVIMDTVSVFEPRVAAALPKSSEAFKEIVDRKAPKKLMPQVLAERTISKRDVTWVKENGICIDLIRADKSTIKQAGMGAFARGKINEGAIISPVPLNTIISSDNMLMYELEEDEETGEIVKKNDIPIGKQLLLNYCFGHGKSKLLLCPMTSAVLINHCSTRKVGEGQCRDKGPNAKIRWGTSWDDATSEWLKKSIREIKYETKLGHRGLSLEVIATTDIAAGQEIFIDYGEEWETAWEKHVEEWKPPESTDDYIPVRSMINSKDFRSLKEQEINPYPSNVQLVCFFNQCPDEEDEEDDEGEKRLYGKSYKSTYGVDNGEESLYPCDILKNRPDGFLDVRVFCNDERTFLLTSYPQGSLTFRMKRYMSDQHLPGAFRHHIGIEDEMFPAQWKNN